MIGWFFIPALLLVSSLVSSNICKLLHKALAKNLRADTESVSALGMSLIGSPQTGKKYSSAKPQVADSQVLTYQNTQHVKNPIKTS